MKVRSLKCVSFCSIQVFEDFGIKCYNKVRKEVFPSPSDLCGLVRILLWFEFLSACPVYLAGHSCLETKKIPMCQLL